MFLKNKDIQIKQKIIILMRLVLSQNYFTFQNKIYLPEKGLSRIYQISSIIAEIFLQYFEGIHKKQLLDTKNIIVYSSYVEDILIL
jgi:hypothetical protein